MITPPSITGNTGVFATDTSDFQASTQPTAPTCDKPQPAGLPDALADACGSALSLVDPLTAFDWGWSTDMAQASTGESVTGLFGLLPPMAYWQADRASDPSMRLAEWRDVFNVARLAEFQIPLRSDPAERTNIILSAQAVDGVTLQPGQVFSFNDIVGERSPDKGYQDGWMFDQGKLIRGTGGGICLVATGLYNVALHAGLGLLERHPHSGLVRYAPPGCDAAVVYGSEDLKFENTTSGPVFVRTIFQGDSVIVALFGTPPPPGYHVVVRPKMLAWLPWQTIEKQDPTLQPGQTIVDQKPHSGYTVTMERVIMQGDRVLRQEVVASDTHKAVDKIVRVPSATPGDDLDSFLSATLDADA
jgi:hypothetical protein